MQIAKDKVVSIDYTLTDDDGTVLDSSEGKNPLEYLHGAGEIIPGLENALEGREAGDELSVVVPPADAYGEHRDGLRTQVARSQFEGVDDLALGMQFRVPTDRGEHVIVTVVDIADDTVTIDGNHPLAGVTLNFAVAVRDVRDPTAEEISKKQAE